MQKEGKWRFVALLATGVAIGVAMVATPAGAHVGGSVGHLWNHLKPKADSRYVNNNELLWAVMESDGTLARDNRAESAQRLLAGQYQVVFNRDVRTCAYGATLADNGTQVPDAGQIGVAPRNGVPNGVFVSTRDAAGTLADRDFHLTVICNEAPKPASPRGVPARSDQPDG